MRLATMILPTHDNDGGDLRHVHLALQGQLVDTFGGFTCVDSLGGWKDDATGKLHVEPGKVYSVAMGQGRSMEWNNLARFYGYMAKQVCVLVSHYNGDVEFVDCSDKVSVSA